MNRSIPDPFQLSRKGSRSDQDPKKAECDPDRELLRSVPDHVWPRLNSVQGDLKNLKEYGQVAAHLKFNFRPNGPLKAA